MHVVLKEIGTGRAILVRQGQVVTVGRTEWADQAFPADPQLQPVHFSIEISSQQVRAICVEDAVLDVDGSEEFSISLTQGLQFTAGGTHFLVESSPLAAAEDPTDGSTAEASAAVESSSAAAGWVSAAATLTALSLDPVADPDMDSLLSPADLIAALRNTDRPADAIQAVAWILPRPIALQWAIDCVETYSDPLSTDDEAAIAVARSWCENPQPDQIQAATEQLEQTGTERPAGWLVQAVCWSGDDLGSSPDIKIPPPPPLFSAAIKGALVSLAFACSSDDPTPIFEECLAAAAEQLPT